jgi:hypothetical protein
LPEALNYSRGLSNLKIIFGTFADVAL